ncbi:MAG: hypothetical protein AAFS10_04970 [Myxococcota bacterium]
MNQTVGPHLSLRWMWVLLSIVVAVAACGESESGGSSTGQPNPAALYGSNITTIVVEVDYATGAEPYIGTSGGDGELWEFFGNHARRMFQASSTAKTITYPTMLEEMEELTDLRGQSFTTDAILAIAETHRDQTSSGTTATFYVVWLDGFFEDSEGPQESVLGVSLGDTGVIAMFKPVIEGAFGPPALADRINRFVEQTTLVHEFGHAAGLVNRGVPLTSEHHDADNGAHCTQSDCVMYFANEGVLDLVDFVAGVLESGETLTFGDACLADMDALASGM